MTGDQAPAALRGWQARAVRLRDSRLAWLFLLLVFALFYYGSYYRHGINFRDEGGTVALDAKRLLEGQRPFLDVSLGYNVLWFYPVVALFKIFGVSFVLLRAYCLALSTVTAVLSFLCVERVSRKPWLAFLVALLPLLVPGMTFKNYMPLLAVANSACLLHAALGRRSVGQIVGRPLRLPTGRRSTRPTNDSEQSHSSEPISPNSREIFWENLTGGIVLGLTFLIRIDLGIFFTALWLGFFALRLFDRTLPIARRTATALASTAVVAAAVLLVHLPIYADARHRGFDREFLHQYPSWIHSLAASLHLGAQQTVSRNAAPIPAVPTNSSPTPAATTDLLDRSAWHEFVTAKDTAHREFIALTYLPLLTLLPLILWALAAFVRATFSQNPDATRRPLAALLMLGGALTTFPQFFFFRPDPPHLSEFSPGFWTGAFCACLLLGQPDFRRLVPRLLSVVLILHAALYLDRMLPDRWTGTIAARKNRTKLFHGDNGVNVFLNAKEFTGLNQVQALIREHSRPGEYLVAYPYHPAFNLLADRPTYEKDVYIDNATRTANWDAEAIARIEKFQPAVIILSDWDINGTEASRFSVWATPTKTWIQTHYDFQGTYLDWYEVFTRR